MHHVDYLGNVSAQIEYSKLSTRWNFPDYWYSITRSFPDGHGGLRTFQLVLIDTVVLVGNSDLLANKFDELPGPDDEELAASQYTWIEQQLSSSTADYLWVGGGLHPAFLILCTNSL